MYKKMKKLITAVIALICVSIISFSTSAVADEEKTSYVGDQIIYLTQKWLNQQYGDVKGFGSVTEDGRTGADTVNGLLRALQYEMGITELANSFGPTTTALYKENPLYRQDGVEDRRYAILQGALWCKGYNPGYNIYESNGRVIFEAVFDENVEKAVISLKKDMGFDNPDGTVTVNVMKALMSMDSFRLLTSYGGTKEIREMQQELNRKYESYTGINPCDGIYGRNTNKALIFALQAEEGLPVSVANGNFGITTGLCCPEIPYSEGEGSARAYPGTTDSPFYDEESISEFTRLLQYALLVNGFGSGEIDGRYDDVLKEAIKDFQKKYALTISGKADKATWMSLLKSSGDTSRSALAADCATILNEAKAQTLYDNGYRYIGRYLTGTYNGGISKAITREEAELILSKGLSFFPIYQTSARTVGYFTEKQGEADAKAAIKAAVELGVPDGTIIYFAVDFDASDSQITSAILPYFSKVSQVMKNGPFRTGIYGVRNACIRAAEKGYTCSSFVSDMSTGYSGNLGFSLPDNWAFDQFATISLGEGDGYIEIDKNAFSGKDYGVSKLEALHIHSYISSLTREATCTQEGERTFVCKCTDSFLQSVPATGKHSGGTATCKVKAKCSVCGAFYGSLKAHTYTNSCDTDCNVCKAKRTTTHTLTTLPAKAPTYTKTGLTEGKKCKVCGKVTVAQKKVDKKKLSKVKIKKAKSSKKKTLSLSWGKVTDATRYQIQYSTSKSFKKKTTKTTKSTKLTIKKLKSKKKYYVRIRAYKVVNGQKVYGSWSTVKSVKIK